MSFKGRFQYVEIDIIESVVVIRTLTEKTAANPTTHIGVVMDTSMDRYLIDGDDAYRMDKVSQAETRIRSVRALSSKPSNTFVHEWALDEGFGTYGIEKKPAGTAEMLLELLNLKEK